MNTFLIDFENVHSYGLKDILDVKGSDTCVIIYTQNASMLNLDVLSSLGAVRLECIKVKAGKQSLDRHLLSYLGFLVAKSNPEDRFIIVSNDSGYDDVAEFWNSRYDTDKVMVKGVQIGKALEDNASVISAEEKILTKSGLLANNAPQYVDICDLNAKIMHQLRTNNVPNDNVGKISSALIANYKAGATRQEMYRALVKKFGQRDGLSYWNIAKVVMPACRKV